MINVDGYMRKERKMLPLVFERSGGCRPSRAKGSLIRIMKFSSRRLLVALTRTKAKTAYIAHGVDAPYGLRHARPNSGRPLWYFFCFRWQFLKDSVARIALGATRVVWSRQACSEQWYTQQ